MVFEEQEHDSGGLDTVLGVLANTYRRRLLIVLLEHNPQDDEDPQIPADVAIEDENLGEPEVAILHDHLPRLEEHGFIEWDRDAHAVRRGPCFEQIRPLLELLRDHENELPERRL